MLDNIPDFWYPVFLLSCYVIAMIDSKLTEPMRSCKWDD